MYQIGQYIGGNHITAKTERGIDIINPAFDEVLGSLHFSTPQQVEKAIQLSEETFQKWSNTSPLKRARVLFNLKMLLEKHMDELATLITNEHGKTFDDAKGEVMRGIEVVEQNCTIGAALKGGYSQSVGTDIDTYTMRQPLGVCAGVAPFNFPIMVSVWMMIPAIACGNTFILKPSEQTPSAPIRLVELLKEAGLPDGVVAVLNGDKETVDALLHDSRVQTATAVASTPVAEYIYSTATANGKRSHTFGGAKNHCLVMPDANIEQAANAITGAAFGAAGERCMALSVAVVIGNPTADKLVEQIKQEVAKIKVGSGLEPEMDMGPLINKTHKARVESLIQSGIDEGATCHADGRGIFPDQPGYFVGPTLFDHVKPNMQIYQQEIFGPVLCVIRVSNYEEAISLINSHEFGNGTAIFTHDGYAARVFASQVHAGMVGINIPIPVPVAYHPFGGWKHSFFGDTNMHGEDSVRFYTKQKTITSRWIKDPVTQNNFVMPNVGD